MTLEQIKCEVEYYTGRKCSDQEAQEIKYYVDRGNNLYDVISAYYGG